MQADSAALTFECTNYIHVKGPADDSLLASLVSLAHVFYSAELAI